MIIVWLLKKSINFNYQNDLKTIEKVRTVGKYSKALFFVKLIDEVDKIITVSKLSKIKE